MNVAFLTERKVSKEFRMTILCQKYSSLLKGGDILLVKSIYQSIGKSLEV